MSKESPYADWRLWFLRALLWLFGWVTSLRKAFYGLFLTISPSIPVDLRNVAGMPPPLRELFWRSFFLAMFFCLIVTGALCQIDHGIIGSDQSRRYFLQDGWNLVLYASICPIYVALCCCVISIAIHEWGNLAEYADAKTIRQSSTRSSLRVYSTFFLILLLCSVFITNFIGDVLNPPAKEAVVARIYWFMNDVGNGTRTLNKVGYYYVALNFSLLFITLLALSCFLTLSAEVLRSGSADSIDKIDDFEVLKSRLESFTKAYLLAKGLVAAYALNVVIWAYSPLGRTDNLLAAQIALTLIGVFFIAVPRQYIELKWFELWQMSGRKFEYSETREWKVRAAASFLDAWFIASIMGIWGLDINGIIARATQWLT